LVISSDDYNKSDLDRILIPISSNISRSCQYDVAVMQDEKCYGATGLRSSSVIRVGKIITLHTNLIKRRLGYLTSDKMVEVNSKIREVINL
jgi:mRNA-degrading endonuclease toxin of MazEF toxin-antitoxin module